MQFQLSGFLPLNFENFLLKKFFVKITTFKKLRGRGDGGGVWKKEKLLITSNFSSSHEVFKRLFLQTRKNLHLFGKGLNHIH